MNGRSADQGGEHSEEIADCAQDLKSDHNSSGGGAAVNALEHGSERMDPPAGDMGQSDPMCRVRGVGIDRVSIPIFAFVEQRPAPRVTVALAEIERSTRAGR